MTSLEEVVYLNMHRAQGHRPALIYVFVTAELSFHFGPSQNCDTKNSKFK